MSRRTRITPAQLRRKFEQADAATERARRRKADLERACADWMVANRRWGLRPEAIRREIGA